MSKTNGNRTETARRPYRISDVTDRFGVTQRLLRFHEMRGLVFPQRLNGNRFYDDADMARIERILSLTRYGFTLAETRLLLDMAPTKYVAELRKRKADLEDEIARSKEALADLDRELGAHGSSKSEDAVLPHAA